MFYQFKYFLGLLWIGAGLISCNLQVAPSGGEHAGEHGEGGHEAHDPHDTAMLSLTRRGELTELFVEFPPLVAGERSAFAVHLTRLDTYKAVEEGAVTVELIDPAQALEKFLVIKPTQPGIFRPVALPTSPGTRQLMIRYQGPNGATDLYDLGQWEVHPSQESAARDQDRSDAQGQITLLKEQQWFLNFRVSQAARRSMRGAHALYGVLKARPEAAVVLTAPASGQLIGDADHWPKVGESVTAEQVLAQMIPKLEDNSADIASLNAAVRQAKLELEHQERELARLEGLLAQGAIPERRVIDARGETAHARVALSAAQQRLRQRERGQGILKPGTQQGSSGEVQVITPRAGRLRAVFAAPGTFIEQGAPLFEVLDEHALWLEVQIPQRLLADNMLSRPEGWFEVLDGRGARTALTESQRVPGWGAVDPSTQAAVMRFAVSAQEDHWMGGLRARVHLYASTPREVVALPRSAILHDAGQDIVFVQRTGESFDRRAVQLGLRDGDWIEITHGLDAGEHVVSEGAYIVKLASSSSQVPAHGHAH